MDMLLLLAGNPQGEGGTLIDFAPDSDRAVMQFGDFANQRQAETGARHTGVLHARNAVKLFEYALEIGLGNAVSVVGHLESDILFIGALEIGLGNAISVVGHLESD